MMGGFVFLGRGGGWFSLYSVSPVLIQVWNILQDELTPSGHCAAILHGRGSQNLLAEMDIDHYVSQVLYFIDYSIREQMETRWWVAFGKGSPPDLWAALQMWFPPHFLPETFPLCPLFCHFCGPHSPTHEVQRLFWLTWWERLLFFRAFCRHLGASRSLYSCSAVVICLYQI